MVAITDAVFDSGEVCLFLYDMVQLFMSCWHDMEIILSVCVCRAASLAGALSSIAPIRAVWIHHPYCNMEQNNDVGYVV